MSTRAAPEGYTSVTRALRLLEVFDRYHASRSVAELAHETGLHKSIVTRLMATMARRGFVVQDPSTRRYRIGPMLFSAGSLYEPFAMYRELAEPVLSDLANRTGYTSCVGVPIGSEVIMVAVVEAPLTNGIRVSMVIGSRRPAYIGATGKVISLWHGRPRGTRDSGQRRAAAVDATYARQRPGFARRAGGDPPVWVCH